MSNYHQALHWLEEAETRTTSEAMNECLLSAQIYATLAVVDAIAAQTQALQPKADW